MPLGTAIDCVGHPTGAQVAAAGHAAIALYVGTPGRAKSPSAAQVADYLRHGVELILVFEDQTGSWRSGRARGAADANAVLAHLGQLGIDWTHVSCVFHAYDSDVVAQDLPVARDYASGAAAVYGSAARFGVYGARAVCTDLLDRGLAGKAWAAAGWQYGHIDPRCVLHQQIGSDKVGGVLVDIDAILAEDFGQYPAVAPAAPPPSSAGPSSTAPAQAPAVSPYHPEDIVLLRFPKTQPPADPPGGRWQDLDPSQWPRSAELHTALTPALSTGGGWHGRGSLSSVTVGWAGGQDAPQGGQVKPSGFVEYIRVFGWKDITYKQPTVTDLVSNVAMIGNMSLPQVPLPDWCTFMVVRYAAPAGLFLGIEYEH